MDHYFLSKWAVERQMKQQFESSPDSENQDDHRPDRPRAFAIRHQLGNALYKLAAIIEPSPSVQKPRLS